jgi:alpha-mannosidase
MADIEEIYLIHHTHTDVGYTHDQPVLWDLQRRHLDTAIDLAAADSGIDEPHAFRWTVETTAPLLHWLDTATTEQIRRLQELEANGRIEITGMFANTTPLFDIAELAESLRPVEFLRDEYGFDVRFAMNCDVNGHSWPLVELLLDAGIEGFTMAINEHFGGTPFERPTVFRWEGPSGRTLPTLNGYHYMAGLHLGIGQNLEEFRTKWWPYVRRHLAEIDYPLPVLPLQTTHPFGDNAPGYDEYRSFIRDWNDQDAVTEGNLPLIRMATPSDWWNVVDDYADDLPTFSGDWTDFWIFGCISSAREQAVNRKSRNRLTTADAVEAGLTAMGNAESERPSTRRSASGTRAAAWKNLMLFDEHTWGADTAVSAPADEDATSQWNHKANYAYTARSHSLLRRRDAIAELSRHVRSTGGERDE